MATLVLTITGAVVGNIVAPGIGGVVGGAIGAAVGSVIDSQVLYPALFPPAAIRAGQIKEFNTQATDEGAGYNYGYGPKVRLNGTVIWLSSVIEKKRESSSKGGNAAKIIKYSYAYDLAVAIKSGPINKVSRIFADGKLVYDDNPDVDFVSNQISCKQVIINGYLPTKKKLAIPYYYLEVTFPKSLYDYTKLRSGRNIQVTGWLNSFNDSTSNPILWIRDNGDNTATFRVLLDQSGAYKSSTEAAGRTITIHQDNEKFDPARFNNLTFYNGSASQSVDPLIESYLLAGNTPAYRGMSYVVIENLALDYYGNRIPNFSFIVEEASTRSIGSVISEVTTKAGLQSSEVDVTALTTNLTGYWFNGPRTSRQILEPVLVANDVAARESNGKITFFKRGTQPKISINVTKLAAREFGDSESVRPANLEDVSEYALPSKVVVNYLDSQADLRKSSQNFRRIQVTQSNISVFDFSMALTSTEAESIAGRILWQAWRNKFMVEITLPPSYLNIEETDLVVFTAYGQTFTMLVNEVTRGVNFLMQLSGTIEEVVGFTGVGENALDLPTNTVKLPPVLMLEIIDIPPLRDEDFDGAGYYYVVAKNDITRKWRGASLYESSDGVEYDFVDSISDEGTMGEVVPASTQYEVVVDNDDNPGTSSSGPWIYSTQDDELIDGDCRISNVEGSAYTWEKNIPAAGEYQVYARFSFSGGRSKQSTYTVFHSSGSTSVVVNQSDDYLSGRWVLLGTWSFNGSGKVTLVVGPGGSASADAVRFFRQDVVNRLGNGPLGYVDRVNSVDVRLTAGSLESRNLSEVLNGLNWALIGSEIVGFQTASLIATNTYRLSNLLRGLRGTFEAIPNHNSGERFTLLNKASLRRSRYDLEAIGRNKYFKVASPGEVLDNVSVSLVRLTGSNILPLPPARLKSYRDSFIQSVWIDWWSRTSYITRAFNSANWLALYGDLLGFDIEILNADGKVVRTIENWLQTSFGNGTNGFDYNSVEQAADGFTTGSTIYFKVYQLSKSVGRGQPATASILSTI